MSVSKVTREVLDTAPIRHMAEPTHAAKADESNLFVITTIDLITAGVLPRRAIQGAAEACAGASRWALTEQAERAQP